MKFIHVSDVNLFSADLETRQNVRTSEDHFSDFQKLIDACRTEQVELLFITGNLFSKAPDEEMLRYADEAFSKLENTNILYVLGPNEAEGGETAAAYSFKSAMKVFTGSSIERVFLPTLGVEVQGVGYSEKTWSRTEIRELGLGKKGAVQILLLPLDLPEVREWPFHYVGAGGSERTEGTPGRRVEPPGSLEPSEFGPFVRHGYYVGEIGVAGKTVIGPAVHFVEGAAREYVELPLTVTVGQSIDDVREAIGKGIAAVGGEHLYRVIIDGVASLSLMDEMDSLLDFPGVASVEHRINLSDTFAALRESLPDDASGRFLRDMMEREPSEVRDRAILYGLKALNGQEEA